MLETAECDVDESAKRCKERAVTAQTCKFEIEKFNFVVARQWHRIDTFYGHVLPEPEMPVLPNSFPWECNKISSNLSYNIALFTLIFRYIFSDYVHIILHQLIQKKAYMPKSTDCSKKTSVTEE